MLSPMNPTTRVHLPHTPAANAAVGVVQVLRAAGFSAYLVGGCVRDLLLGQVPKDFDIATEALPADVRPLFVEVVEVGAAFGVLRVQRTGEDGVVHEVEVATFRAESDYRDGRRPENVRFTDAREDVRRRDFTINGLLCDPLDVTEHGAAVVDWVSGLDDLRAHRLRAIGHPSERFAEDALRMLRAPRFAARFGLTLDPQTTAAIQERAPTLARVSAERVRDELARMLTVATAPRALQWMHTLGLAAVLFPETAAHAHDWDDAVARMNRLYAALALTPPPPLTVPCLTPQSSVDFPLAIAVLLHPHRRAWSDDRIIRTCRMSGAELKRLAHVWSLADALGPVLPTPHMVRCSPPWIRLLRQPDADAALLLRQALDPHESTAAQLRLLRANTAILQWFPTPALTGHDLTAAGYRPSPRFAEALAAAEDAQLLGQPAHVALEAAYSRLRPPA